MEKEKKDIKKDIKKKVVAKAKKVSSAKKTNTTKKTSSANKTGKSKKNLKVHTKEFYEKENLKSVFLEEVEKEHKLIVLFVTAVVVSLIIYFSLSFILNSVKVSNPSFINIDALKYEKLVKDEKKKVVLITSPSKSFNIKYKKIVKEVIDDKDMDIYYLDLDQVLNDNLLNTFMLATEETKESFKDPMLMIFEDGKVKDMLTEVATKEELYTFFEKNRID